jgi:transposase
MCDEAGVHLEYLSPYSPDYNSIEEAFATVQCWIKLNYVIVDDYETFDNFLEAGKAGNHFRSCHIHVEG